MVSITVIIFVILNLLILVASNDLSIGHATPFSKKIYSAIKNVNPALWKRREYVMVSAPNNDYISAVYVTDLRSDKEGEAYIAAGGIGQKTVTIALKSPSILSGYKFSIEVYAESIRAYTSALGMLSGLSGSYPSTYPVGGTYPVGNVHYPGVSYPQYPIGR